MKIDKFPFDAADFLATAGLGRKIIHLHPGETFFRQGERADAVFYLQKGCAVVTVLSSAGKEATITLHTTGDFLGESALVGMEHAALVHGYRDNRLPGIEDQAR